MFPLLSLPNELLDAIISTLNRPALLALAQTSSKLQPFAEAQLFKSIYIRDGPSVRRLIRDLDQPPERVRAVQHLEVTPTMHSWRGVEEMPEVVGRLVRLKTLKVESPMINSGRKPEWWGEVVEDYIKVFRGMGEGGALGCLTSCRSKYWLVHPVTSTSNQFEFTLHRFYSLMI